MSLTAAQALRDLNCMLFETAGEEAAQQARLLLCHVLGFEPGELPFKRGDTLTAEQEQHLFGLAQRRLQHEPLQYLLGEWGFMGLTFQVRHGVLIPRQDTETLCEHALHDAKVRGYRTALDLCCGTGCIGVSLAKLGGLTVTASDLSPDCVALTRENAAKNGVRLTVLTGSWFAPVSGRFDLIVCNPPYLTQGDMNVLQQEVRFEPSLALYGGPDGLDAYRSIADGWREHIAPGGELLLEVGAGQAGAVRALFGGKAEIWPDYNGVLRVVCVQAP